MDRDNLRIVNENEQNGHLVFHHQQIQNRVNDVFYAYDKFGESMNIDLIADTYKTTVR
jgi:hypothetical protein